MVQLIQIGKKLRYLKARSKYRLLRTIGLDHLLLRNRDGALIFVFHGLSDRVDLSINSRFISKTYFEHFLQAIRHYNLLSLADFYDVTSHKKGLNLTLTFDDGYLNNYHYAVPLLEKYEIPATFFITPIAPWQNHLWPDFIDLAVHGSSLGEVICRGKVFKKNRDGEYVHKGLTLKATLKQCTFEEIDQVQDQFKPDWQAFLSDENADYWKLMQPDHLKYLSDHPLFEIGAHGLTHASLIHLPQGEAEFEIRKSKERLEEICGVPMRSFAFPFGDYHTSLIDYCRSLGFDRILLVDDNGGDAMLGRDVRKRFVSNPHIPLGDQISCLLKGSYF